MRSFEVNILYFVFFISSFKKVCWPEKENYSSNFEQKFLYKMLVRISYTLLILGTIMLRNNFAAGQPIPDNVDLIAMNWVSQLLN